MTRTIREYLRAGHLGDLPKLMRKGRDLYAMQLFDEHLIDLVNSGLIARVTAIHASSNPEELERALHGERGQASSSASVRCQRAAVVSVSRSAGSTWSPTPIVIMRSDSRGDQPRASSASESQGAPR